MIAPAPTNGAQLGRYELVRRLALRELTELWLARLSGAAAFERYVVIKLIREDRASDAVFVQSFMTEARVAGALHHHNIVQVQDIGEDAGRHYLMMEYVHGESLRRVLAHLHERREQMPLQHVLAVVGAVASALHHAHEVRGADKQLAGIVHRAVTPGNIIVGYDGNVKVVDFGVAKAALRTAEGTVVGSKVPYLAPEECTGQIVDRRADVFALGVVLHEAVTGRRLFKAESAFLTMSAIAHAVVPRASEYRKDLPQPLEAIITKALARVPAERYQTADELRLALEPIATKLATGIVPAALAAYMKQLFGARREPWLDTVELVAAPIDFDGPASGLAIPRPPIVPRKRQPEPTGEFTDVDVRLPESTAPFEIAPADEPTAIVEPLPIEGTSRLRSLGAHKRLAYVVAGALVAIAAVIVFLSVTAPPTLSTPVTHAPAQDPSRQHEPMEEPSASAAVAKPMPASEPPPTSTVEVAEPAPTSEPIGEATPKHASAHHKLKPAAKQGGKLGKPAANPEPSMPKNWDPDSLFYGKK